MRALQRNSFMLERDSGGGYYSESGKWVAGVNTLEPFVGSIQPTGKGTTQVQKILPSGVRLEDTRFIYTRTELRTGDDRTGSSADLVTFINPASNTEEIYEVFKVDPWYGIKRLSHYKAYVYLKDRAKIKEESS